MPDLLSRNEAVQLLGQLRDSLAPDDLSAVSKLCAALDASTNTLTVDRALQLLYPQHEHKPATDAFSKLRTRFAAAVRDSDLPIALVVKGAKKHGAAGRALMFEGRAPVPAPPLPALEMTRGRFVPSARAVPEDGAVALLVTVNKHESQAVLDTFLSHGEHPKSETRGRHVYQDLGLHGDFRVVHMTCEMGSSGPGAAVSRVKDGIRDWSPAVVIGVGIAFGARPDEQAHGDVLISRQVLNYEPQRVSKGRRAKIMPRGDRVTSSTEWLDRFRQIDAACQRSHWPGWPSVHFGLLLSGEKLVDNKDYRESLLSIANGQAIGGEMEASGIYTAAADERAAWIVVKAISDWANGEKSGRTAEQKRQADAQQRHSADQAALVVRAALRQLPPEPKDRACATEYSIAEPIYRTEYDIDLRFVGPRALATTLDKFKPGEESSTRPRDRDAAVEVLDYLQRWLLRPDGAPVFALLGEYGMGKTVTCQRLSRTLNAAYSKDSMQRPALYFDLRALQNQRGRIPTLQDILHELIARDYRGPDGEPSLTPARVHALLDQGALVIFDGLDEALVHFDEAPGQAFTRELLGIHRRGSRGRVLVTCRTHFFRSLRDQRTHLTGEDRSGKGSNAFEALTLLPFSPEQIRQYLRQSVPGIDEEQLLSTIRAVHDLSELAERPYTLSLIVQFLPELERLKASGRKVYGVTLYRNMVRSWLERDHGKHHLKPEHKMRLAADLAAQMWRSGRRTIAASELERWFGQWLRTDEDLCDRYGALSRDKLEEDLRNSTFLVRDDGDKPELGVFRFAHSSMQEFFLAAYLLQAARDDAPQKWQLSQAASRETIDFLGQLLAESADSGDRSAIDQMAKWRLMYRAGTSELLLAFALQARGAGWPTPPLTNFDLRGAALQGWHIESRCGDTRLDLEGSQFDGAVLREATFDNVRLVDATFRKARLQGAEFLRCDLQGTEFVGAEGSGAAMRECNLRGASLRSMFAHHMRLVACTDVAALPQGTLLAPAAASFARLATLSLLPSTEWNAVALSPNGTYVVSAGDDGTVRVWDARSGDCVRTLYEHRGGALSCTYSPDGKRIVSAGVDECVRLWDAYSGECMRTLQGHRGWVHSCAYAPDGARIVSAGNDGSVRVWDAHSGECVHTLNGHEGRVHSCAYAPDGAGIVSTGDDGVVRVWDAHSGDCLLTLQVDQRRLLSCAYSPDGAHIASAGDDGITRVWDVRSGRCIRMLNEHESGVQSCAYSPDGAHIALARGDGTVRIWDALTGNCMRTLQGHLGWVRSCAYTPDEAYIVSAGKDGAIRLWDAYSGDCVRTLLGREGGIQSCAGSPDGALMASAGFDGTVHLWVAHSGECARALRGHEGKVRSCVFALGGEHIASAGEDRSVRVWEVHTGECVRTLQRPARSVALAPDGARFVLAGFDDTLSVWDTPSGAEICTLQGHRGWVEGCAYSFNGAFVVSAGIDGTVRVWDARSGECLRILIGHQGGVRSCVFSPNGAHVVSSGMDGTVRVWDASSGECLRTLQGHQREVRSCTYSPDGMKVVSGGVDGTVRVWDANSGECMYTLQGHRRPVRSCAYAAHGALIVSAGDDGIMRMWSSASGKPLIAAWASSTGHLVWQPATNHIIEAEGDAWRSFGWEGFDDKERMALLPLETFGMPPGPKCLAGRGASSTPAGTTINPRRHQRPAPASSA